MKKVIFSNASENVVHVNDVGNYRIIGYAGKNGPIKGIMVLAHSRTLGVTLVNGPANEDRDVPAVHPELECSTQAVSEMMEERQDEFDFYVFKNMEDFLNWIWS